jgi:hypothetical protein
MANGGAGSGSGSAAISPSPPPGAGGARRGDEASAGADAVVRLPPPTPTDPLPALGAALRLDNREQLLQAVFEAGGGGGGGSGGTGGGNNHFLVFSDSSLRTLLLRQVWDDPTRAAAASKPPNKKDKSRSGKSGGWEGLGSFPFLPRSVVGTSLLIPDPDDVHGGGGNEPGEDSSTNLWPDTLPNSADVVTYVISTASASLPPLSSPSSASSSSGSSSWPDSLRRLAGHLRLNAKRGARYRVLFVPQPGAAALRVLASCLAGGSVGSSSSASLPPPGVTILNHPAAGQQYLGCQLDLFPLETDVITMHANSVLRSAAVDQLPSGAIQHCARALLKLQDAVGTIPRVQAIGGLAEEVVKKMMALRVDEHLSRRAEEDGEGDDNLGGGPGSPPPHSSVAALVVLDRRADYVTPLLTPLTYEGLLDEVFGIEAGHLRVPESVLRDDDDDGNGGGGSGAGAAAAAPPAGGGGTDRVVSLPLNGGDALYAEVRDQHVERFGTFLQNQARALRESHASFASTSKKKDLAEIHQFVKQIPVFTQNLRSLTNHIQLAERIRDATQTPAFREQWQLERSILEGEPATLDAVEELAAAQCPPWKLLRLLCLQSLCQGGIKASRYDSIKRDVVQAYGLRYLVAIANLERAGLLSRREGLWGVDAPSAAAGLGVAGGSSSAFYAARNALHLIHAEVDTIDPDDIAYVSSGYAPLSVRLVQTAVKGFSSGREEILRENLVPGSGGGSGGGGGGLKFVDVLQRRSPPEDLAAALKRGKPPGSLGQWAERFASHGGGGGGRRKPTLVVFYVGGVTYMELASLRFLSKRPAFPYHVVCLATDVVNGTTLLRALAL